MIVNDGASDSAPDEATLSTANSKPVANAGRDQDAVAGLPVTVDGSGSSDADHVLLSYHWAIITTPDGKEIAMVDPLAQVTQFTPLLVGEYVAQLIVNDGKVDSDPDTALVRVTVAPPSNQPPRITSTPVVTATTGKAYHYTVRATDPDVADTVSYTLKTHPTGMTIGLLSGVIDWTPTSVGSFDVTVEASDGTLKDAQSFVIVVSSPLPVHVPDLAGMDQAQATNALESAGLVLGIITQANSDSVPAGHVISQTPEAGADAAPGSVVDIVLSLGPAGGPVLPPDPATVAPKIDESVQTTPYSALQFLYSGANPIQTGVSPDAIDPKRAGGLRGRVLDRQNTPVPGVTISVLNHPELGQTLSRADGWFDIAVNGGGVVTITYAKDGFLIAQRQIDLPWQDFQVLPDVVLTTLDPAVTTVDLAAPGIKAARGSAVTDSSGTRRATVLIPSGIHAQVLQSNGTPVEVNTLNIHLTEYTVGAKGPQAMPAALPPTSGYTYAVEITAEEAIAKIAGKDVLFSAPVSFYLENFLSFPTGTQVPMGYYDRDKASWVPSLDGRVIKILSVANGLAEIDTDGDGAVDNGVAIGITDEERGQLATLYGVDQTLERVPIVHFSTYDPNYGVSPPPDATPPATPLAQNAGNSPPNPCNVGGSIIGCEGQTLGEVVAITGTPFNLHYNSERVPGRQANNTLQIPLSGAQLPASLKRIDLEITIAGRLFTQSFPPNPNQRFSFEWDGLDAFGRKLQGSQTAKVRIGYVYQSFYNLPPSVAASFGLASGMPVPGNVPARQDAEFWQEQSAVVGTWDARGQGLGGWTLNVQHSYDPFGKDLYRGDGERRSGQAVGSDNVITTAAGNGTQGFSGDGGPAIAAAMGYPLGIALDPDGNLYIVDGGNHRIRRVGTDGVITTVVGGGDCYPCDGGPATNTYLVGPNSIAFGPDGSFYFTDINSVRRVGVDGIITTVAGTYGNGYGGDGGPATQATLSAVQGIGVGPDNALYISDSGNNRVRRIGPDGIITTVAGNGNATGPLGDGGPATAAVVNPDSVTVGPDGSLYIGDRTQFGRIRRVGPDGIITTVAGGVSCNTTESCLAGDGGPATQAPIVYPRGLSFARDGSLYIADSNLGRIRRVGRDGIITTVAGTGTLSFPGDGDEEADGRPANAARLSQMSDVAVAPDGSYYISDTLVHRIRHVSSRLPGFGVTDFAIASDDGSELYQFDSDARHLRTLSTLTGAVLYEFVYDGNGHLTTVTDGDHNVTTIERDGTGNPTAILAPFGQRTTLAVDANAYLTQITNPAGEAYRISYDAGGLMTQFTDPKGNTATMTYDALGRLLTDTDAASGTQTLARTDLASGYEATRSTPLNRVSRHQVETLSNGDQRRVYIPPDGIQVTTINGADGTVNATLPDGTVTTTTNGPDPRFGMQSALPVSVKTVTGGLTSTLAIARSVNLSSPGNPVSLSSLTDTFTTNGRTSTSSYAAATKTFTNTSAAGRVIETVIDTLGRVTKIIKPGVQPVNLTYDLRGRPDSITQGSGAEARTVAMAYNAEGYLSSITDPLGHSAG